MTLISRREANEAIFHLVQLRRLRLYDFKSLTKIYFFEKNKILVLYEKIGKIYDVKRLSFAFDFNINSRYIEHCRFKNATPDKEIVVEKIIIFFRTKYLIKNYLKQLEELKTLTNIPLHRH